VEDNRVPLQLVSLGPLIGVKQPGPADEIFSLFNEQSVGLSIRHHKCRAPCRAAAGNNESDAEL
jgi:hypothetical protein